MKSTIVTFKALSDGGGKIVHKNIAIQHDFSEIPSETFLGVKLPPTSVESQVIDYLDGIDKTELMNKHGFSVILDYYVRKRKRRNQVAKDEFYSFIAYINPILDDVSLKRPIEAIISESYSVLFGCGKSNKQKFREVMNCYRISMKAVNGVIRMISERDHACKLCDALRT